MTLDINALYDALQNGDKTAEEQLFSLLTVRFRILANYRIWNEKDAEDITQEALAVVAREYRSLEVSVSFAAWACKVLDNRILSYIKTRQREMTSIDDDPPERNTPDPEFKIRLLDCVQKVRRANIRYGRAVLLHYQGYTTAEICKRMDVTTKNYYMILSRARAMLRRCLETGGIA